MDTLNTTHSSIKYDIWNNFKWYTKAFTYISFVNIKQYGVWFSIFSISHLFKFLMDSVKFKSFTNNTVIMISLIKQSFLQLLLRSLPTSGWPWPLHPSIPTSLVNKVKNVIYSHITYLGTPRLIILSYPSLTRRLTIREHEDSEKKYCCKK